MIDLQKQLIQEAIRFRLQSLQELKTAVKSAEQPTLKLNVTGGSKRTQYYVREKGQLRYLSKAELAEVRELAQQEYHFAAKNIIDQESRFWTKVLKGMDTLNTIEAYYHSLSSRRQELIQPLVLTDKQFAEKWSAISFAGKAAKDWQVTYRTERGEQVKSKSELYIANTAAHQSVLYKYECPIWLPTDGRLEQFSLHSIAIPPLSSINQPATVNPSPDRRTFRLTQAEKETVALYEELFGADSIEAELHRPGPGKIKVHVDFTLLDLKTRREYYWEHFGMMDHPEYLTNFHKKMQSCHLSGLSKTGRFLSTFESELCPLDTREIQSILAPFSGDGAILSHNGEL